MPVWLLLWEDVGGNSTVKIEKDLANTDSLHHSTTDLCHTLNSHDTPVPAVLSPPSLFIDKDLEAQSLSMLPSDTQSGSEGI